MHIFPGSAGSWKRNIPGGWHQTLTPSGPGMESSVLLPETLSIGTHRLESQLFCSGHQANVRSSLEEVGQEQT